MGEGPIQQADDWLQNVLHQLHNGQLFRAAIEVALLLASRRLDLQEPMKFLIHSGVISYSAASGVLPGVFAYNHRTQFVCSTDVKLAAKILPKVCVGIRGMQ